MQIPQISIRQIPLVIGFIFFSVGIIISDKFEFNYTLVGYSLIIWIIFILSAQSIFSKQGRTVLIAVALLFCGSLHHSFQRDSVHTHTIPQIIGNKLLTYKGLILSVSNTDQYLNLVVDINEIYTSDFGHYKIRNQKSLFKIKNKFADFNISPGNTILISSKLKPISPNKKISGFDYETFLFRSGITNIGFVQSYQVTPTKRDKFNNLRYIRIDLRAKAIQRITSFVKTEKTRAVLNALLLGYKNDIDELMIEDFVKSGTMHILAVSGLHVGIVAYIIFFIISKICYKLSKYSIFKVLIIITCLSIFAELSGGGAPVWRAVLMTSIFLIGRAMSYEVHSLNLLGLAAFILILIDVQNLFSVSFQLSFIAVVGIVLCYPILARIYNPKHPILKYITGIVYMGISAQIALLPLSLYYFNQISWLSPFTSIIAISAAFSLITIGIFILTIGWSIPMIKDFINNILDVIISILEYITSHAAQLKFTITENVYLDLYQVLLIFTFLLFTIFSYYQKSRYTLTIGLFSLMIHGFYNSAKKIEHIRCIDIEYDRNQTVIKEIFIGRTVYINKNIHEKELLFAPKRKKHIVNKFETIEL